jgi:drug/metabolite transporter (DMT)-like permease
VTAIRAFILTAVAMIAFAGNSLLCRVALRGDAIDPASFTLIRIASGAMMLSAIALVRNAGWRGAGNWPSAIALFSYAAAFSFAYLSLSAGTGALLLFGAVQATMILWGWWRGERLRALQLVGLALTVGGLVALVFPGLSAPSFAGSSLMIAAGFAWGVYSLRGKAAGDPVRATAGNFIRAVPFAIALGLAFLPSLRADAAGLGYAILSGAIASALGYAIWYSVLPSLHAANAATVQLSVPVLTALAGILLLGEPLTLRFLVAAVAILGGIALVVINRAARGAESKHSRAG